LAAKLVGAAPPVAVPWTAGVPGAEVLTVRELGTAAVPAVGGVALRDVEITLRAGEILGIAGVDGNGQTALSQVLLGWIRPLAGSIAIRGVPLPPRGRSQHMAVIPADRTEQGLCRTLSVAENLALGPSLGLGRLRRRDLARAARTAIEQYRIANADPEGPVGALSGGNQQKVIVARALASGAGLLLALAPTRGLDLAASAAVHGLVRRFVAAGGACLLVSVDLDEVLTLSHRVLVLHSGRLTASIAGPFAVQERRRIGLAMTGGESP
jgi:simple sugar transport system ATP-binding protein